MSGPRIATYKTYNPPQVEHRYLAMRLLPWPDEPLDGVGYAPVYETREEAERENPGAVIVCVEIYGRSVAA